MSLPYLDRLEKIRNKTADSFPDDHEPSENAGQNKPLFSPTGGDDKSPLWKAWSQSKGKNVKDVTTQFESLLQDRINTERAKRGSVHKSPVPVDKAPLSLAEDSPRSSSESTSAPSPNRLWNSLLPAAQRWSRRSSSSSSSNSSSNGNSSSSKPLSLSSSPIRSPRPSALELEQGISSTSTVNSTSRGGIWHEVDSVSGNSASTTPALSVTKPSPEQHTVRARLSMGSISSSSAAPSPSSASEPATPFFAQSAQPSPAPASAPSSVTVKALVPPSSVDSTRSSLYGESSSAQAQAQEEAEAEREEREEREEEPLARRARAQTNMAQLVVDAAVWSEVDSPHPHAPTPASASASASASPSTPASASQQATPLSTPLGAGGEVLAVTRSEGSWLWLWLRCLAVAALALALALHPANPHHKAVLALMPPPPAIVVGQATLFLDTVKVVGGRVFSAARLASAAARERSVALVLSTAQRVPSFELIDFGAFMKQITPPLLLLGQRLPLKLELDSLSSALTTIERASVETAQELKVFFLPLVLQARGWARHLRIPALPAPPAFASSSSSSSSEELAVVPFQNSPPSFMSGLGVAALAVGVALVVGAYASWQACPEQTRAAIVERVIEMSPQPVRRLLQSPRYTRSMTQSAKKGPAQSSSRAGARRAGAKKLF